MRIFAPFYNFNAKMTMKKDLHKMVLAEEFSFLHASSRALWCYHFNTMPAYLIAIIVGAAIAAVVVLALVAYFVFFASARYKKQVGELSRRFEYLHALLFGQDAQYVKRIEMISLTNLLYVNAHMNFNKRFKDVRDKSDSSAQTAINNLKDLLVEKNFKSLKAALPEAKAVLAEYEQQVNSLNNDLLAVIKPEEDCRQQSLLLKEKLRKIKSDYYLKQTELALVENSFSAVFNKLDEQFKMIDGYVESAKYEEAKAELPRLEGVIVQLAKALAEMPNLCASVQSVIPDKISSLQNRYEEMQEAEYPLNHLLHQEGIDELRKELDEVSSRLQKFELRGVSEQLDGLREKIEDYFDSFEKEKTARLVFEEECEGIYQEAAKVDQKYIRLCNALPGIKNIYVIEDSQQQQLDSIKEAVNKSGATKRSLDALINGAARQPYSLLVSKMHSLSEESRLASEKIDDFDRYLRSLKTDSEDALKAIGIYFKALKESEAVIADFRLEAIEDKYSQTLETLYGYIDQIYLALMKKPIAVGEVDSLLFNLRQEGDAMLSSIKKDHEDMYLCDSTIVYANRQRRNLSEIRDLLSQAENLYFQGRFSQSYLTASEALKHQASD